MTMNGTFKHVEGGGGDDLVTMNGTFKHFGGGVGGEREITW